MKIALLAVLLALAGSAPVLAERYEYPGDGDALFSIDVPDGWQVSVEEQVLHTGPPDESIYVGLWALDGVSLDSAGEAIDQIVSELIRGFEIEEEDELEIDGMPFVYFEGWGYSREDGSPLNASIALFSPDGDSVCTIFYFGSPDAERVHEKMLDRMLGSIRRE